MRRRLVLTQLTTFVWHGLNAKKGQFWCDYSKKRGVYYSSVACLVPNNCKHYQWNFLKFHCRCLDLLLSLRLTALDSALSQSPSSNDQQSSVNLLFHIVRLFNLFLVCCPYFSQASFSLPSTLHAQYNFRLNDFHLYGLNFSSQLLYSLRIFEHYSIFEAL